MTCVDFLKAFQPLERAYMDIKIDGNPGTGNTFQEIYIGTVQNYNPNATTVINYFGTEGDKKEAKDEKPQGKSPMEMRDIPPIREQIMLYVSCLNTEDIVAPDWLGAKYMNLWDAILNIPEVEAEVYNPGNQHKTSFNRNLVGNIIYYLAIRHDQATRVYKELNATRYAEKLEGSGEHSVRLAMGKLPKDGIKKSLDKFMDNYLL